MYGRRKDETSKMLAYGVAIPQHLLSKQKAIARGKVGMTKYEM